MPQLTSDLVTSVVEHPNVLAVSGVLAGVALRTVPRTRSVVMAAVIANMAWRVSAVAVSRQIAPNARLAVLLGTADLASFASIVGVHNPSQYWLHVDIRVTFATGVLFVALGSAYDVKEVNASPATPMLTAPPTYVARVESVQFLCQKAVVVMTRAGLASLAYFAAVGNVSALA
ncbi:hypothetical protein BWQ96_06992 [Gracilariopsis chorda]|uniref:Uncharacterized protein n=1 Tax=Gracilariopsis chorda TaxID=448386 RepID=A0A2V3IMF6_9FLOR|nr:hypothetical protein BWQ96_06992 [Gracilariopsis chorda]|eukprot:PXF43265.1 hypothetical protein BWQ96_06992 [Gracilariopsis chorda]